MLVFLGKVCLSLLLILGAVEAIRIFLRALLHTGKTGKIYFILAFRGHDEEAELALRAAVQKLKWLGGGDEKRILCLDCGMDEETREICGHLQSSMALLRFGKE